MDQPAKFEGRVIVSGNCRDRALEERNFRLIVSTRVVMPLYALSAVVSGWYVGTGILFVLVVVLVLEVSGVPKQPQPMVP